MELMVPNQINKDLVFNESTLMMDIFLSNTIDGLIKEPPKELCSGEKFIITEGDRKNQICYRSHKYKGIDYITPNEGMFFFLSESKSFILYKDEEWIKIDYGKNNNYVDQKFTGISGIFRAVNNKSHFYLYLDQNTKLDFQDVTISEITIIIKQCYNNVRILNWPSNILWENKLPHKITQSPNAVDIIKLYKLPETAHFIGKIIAKSIKY